MKAPAPTDRSAGTFDRALCWHVNFLVIVVVGGAFDWPYNYDLIQDGMLSGTELASDSNDHHRSQGKYIV